MITITSCYILCCQSNHNKEVFIPFKVYHSRASALNAFRIYHKRYPNVTYKVYVWEGGLVDYD